MNFCQLWPIMPSKMGKIAVGMLFGIEIIDEIIQRNSSKLPEKMYMTQDGGFLGYLLYLSHMT